VERVAATLGAYPHCELGEGDVDRAVRAAFESLWTPPPVEEVRNASRWNRSTLGFDRVSKRAVQAASSTG
jgi:hypothetical protein